MVAAVESMAYRGEVPWHGLGVKLSAEMNPQQMQVAAGLDWRVEKVPVEFTAHGFGRQGTGAHALYRSNDGKFLDIVRSDDWTPVQNDTAFEFFARFVAAGDMTMETAGSLLDGKRVFALAKMRDGFTLRSGDAVESYLLFSNPHLYGHSVTVAFTPIRVVCMNTLTVALAANVDQQVRVTHSQPFDPDKVAEVLGLASNQLSIFREKAELLARQRYTERALREFFDRVFPRPAGGRASGVGPTPSARKAMDAVERQPGATLAPGTWWNAYNAVSFLTDHKLGRRQETRLNSALFGHNRRRKAKALDLAVEYAKTSA